MLKYFSFRLSLSGDKTIYLNPNFFDISSASEIAKFIKYLNGLRLLIISRF